MKSFWAESSGGWGANPMKVRFNCQSIFLCVFNQYLRLIIARVSGGEISIIDEKRFSSSAGYCALPPSPFFMELFIARVSVMMSDGRNSAGAQEGRCPGPGTQCVGAAAPQVTVCLSGCGLFWCDSLWTTITSFSLCQEQAPKEKKQS